MARKRHEKGSPVNDQAQETTEGEETPPCYGTFDGSSACLKECVILDTCRRLTGKRNSPTRGLSKGRAIKAFCRGCNGSSRAGCPCAACPFYAFLKPHRQLAGDADLWWTGPAGTWEKAELEAHRKKRTIREDTVERLHDCGSDTGDDLDGDDEEDEGEEDE